MRNCTQDMGLGKNDVQKIYDAWRQTIAGVRDAIVEGGGYNYQMFASTSTPATIDKCLPLHAVCLPEGKCGQACLAGELGVAV